MQKRMMPWWLALLLWAGPLVGVFPSEIFPVGPKTRLQIDFWKKIYTEIHDDEGLIHDSEDLTLIYRRVRLPEGLRPRQQQQMIDQIKEQITQLLQSIVQKGGVQLTSEEEKMFNQLGRPSLDLIKVLGPRMRYQRGQKEKFYRGLRQSELYLPHIRQALRQWQVPEDLAYLPHVESSFNYQAFSKVGAAGIWQFMRSTARHYRLKMDYLLDERRDPLKSTIAAARMLKFNYQKLKSWPLAITAYNHGVNSMVRAVEQVKDHLFESIVDRYRNRRFGFASKNFYPCFMAAREIAQDPAKYFPEIKNETPLAPIKVVKINRPFTLTEILRITGLSQAELSRYNPGFRPAAFAPTAVLSGKDPLALPAYVPFGPAEIAQLRLPGKPRAVIAAAVPTKTPLPAPAILTKTTPVDPKQASPARSLWAKIKNFFWPSSQKNLSPVLAQAPTAEELNDPQQALRQEAFAFQGVQKQPDLYQIQVEPSETLGHYVDWSQVPLEELQKLNHLKGEQIQLGQKFNLPLTAALAAQFAEKRKTFHQVLREDFLANFVITGVQKYIVQPGDTLYKIAQKFKMEIWPFRLLMPASWDLKIYPGQTLTLPQLEPKNSNALE